VTCFAAKERSSCPFDDSWYEHGDRKKGGPTGSKTYEILAWKEAGMVFSLP
jgi:hypothetical protein